MDVPDDEKSSSTTNRQPQLADSSELLHLPDRPLRGTLTPLFSAETHPAERSVTLLSELDQLSKTAGYLQRQLGFVKQDMVRATKYGKRIIYLLDFSELYGILWKDRSTTQTRHIIRYLLDHTAFEFALPPGAVIELIRKLTEHDARARHRRDEVRKLLSSPVLSGLLRYVGESARHAGAEAPAIPSAALDTVLEALVEAHSHNEGLTLLSELFAKGRLRRLTSLVSPDAIAPDDTIYSEARYQLLTARSWRDDTVSEIDAHNYAVTYALNTSLGKSNNVFFLLVTSSPVPYRVFQTIKWKDDPLFAADSATSMRTSLVRHPVDLLYLARLQSRESGGTRDVDRALRDLKVIQDNWSNLASYKRFKSQQAPGSHPVSLPHNKRYLASITRFAGFYHSIVRPVAELLQGEAALEENRRRLLGVATAGIGARHLWQRLLPGSGQDSSLLQGELDYRGIVALYDRVIALTQRAATEAKTHLRGVTPGAVRNIGHGVLFHPDRLTWQTTREPNEGVTSHCLLLTRLGGGGTPIAHLDQHPDYWSMWWTTNVDFLGFLKAARLYRYAMGHHHATRHSSAFEKPLGRAFSGVTAFTDEGIRMIDTEARLDESLLEQCDPAWRIRFVRISLEAGDLCYDFEPVYPFPQRAGLVTHSPFADGVADLLQWTHSKFLQRHSLVRALKRVFAN